MSPYLSLYMQLPCEGAVPFKSGPGLRKNQSSDLGFGNWSELKLTAALLQLSELVRITPCLEFRGLV